MLCIFEFAIGMLAFKHMDEDDSWMEALRIAVYSITSVGMGQVVPTTNGSKVGACRALPPSPARAPGCPPAPLCS